MCAARETPLTIGDEGDKALEPISTALSSLDNSKTVDDIFPVVQHFLEVAIEKSTLRKPTADSGEGTSSIVRTSSNPIYASVALSDYKSRTRLVELLPGKDGDPVVAKLFAPGAIDSQAYEALSYVWGARDADETISLNGEPFTVSGNLAHALRCLRPTEGGNSRILWIDAICIDQDNNPEKSAQVAFMGQIYREAADVLIFLGEEKDDSTLVMQYLDLPDVEQDEQLFPRGIECGCKEGDCRAKNRILHCGFDESRFINAAYAFFKRPWWSRMWVVQEFALARQEPKWYCGRTRASSRNLRNELKLLQNHLVTQTMPMVGQPHLIVKSRMSDPVEWLSFWRCKYNINQILSSSRHEWGDMLTAQLMLKCLLRESTDPLDRIFALYELHDPVSKRVLYPDYSVDLSDAMEIFSAYILIQGHLVLHNRLHLVNSASLPSWTVDFTKPISQNVSGSLKDSKVKRGPMAIHRGILGAQGVILDTLDVVYDLEGCKDDLGKLGLLWKLEAIVEFCHPPDPVSEHVKSSLPKTFFAPSSVTWRDFRESVSNLVIPFPVSHHIWGMGHFLADVMSDWPSIPFGLEPEKVTCDKWQRARPIPAHHRVLELLGTTGKHKHPESFIGGCCFDLANLKSQINAINFQDETESSTNTTARSGAITQGQEYIPQYSYIKDVLRKAINPTELKFLQAVICSLADHGASIVSQNMRGQAPPLSQSLQNIANKIVRRHNEAINSYNQIWRDCNCGEEKGERHRKNLEEMVQVVEEGKLRQQKCILEFAQSDALHYDSSNSANYVARDGVMRHTGAFVTNKGFVGFTLQDRAGIKRGDTLAKIRGMSSLAVLGGSRGEGTYRLKGFCYVLGIEDEEVEKLVGLGVGVEREIKID